jgi:hypothetical protein
MESGLKNGNNEMQISESLPCGISALYVEWFIGHIENSINALLMG